MSNSKLALDEKADRKTLLKQLHGAGGEVYSFLSMGVTVLVCPSMPEGKMGVFAVSICSPDEIKFRRKVGEYRALCRWVDGNTQPLSMRENMYAACLNIAVAVSTD